MKHLQLSILFCALFLWGSLFGQTPEKMTYQAVVRDMSQALVANTAVGVQITIRQGNPTGTILYQETHSSSTNANGLMSLEIGTGTVLSGSFSTVDWGSDEIYLQVDTDPNGGTNYSISGVSQLLSVPYALYAKSAKTVDSLTITGNEPAFVGWDQDESDDFDGQYSSLSGAPTNVSAFTNDAGYLNAELDGDPTNEIQMLSISNDTIYLSNGGFVVLPAGTVDTDDQTLSISNDTLFIQDGNSVDLSPYTVDNVNDADADPTNEFNTSAQINGSNLEITDGGGTISVNLGTLPADSDWLETGGNVVRTSGRVGVRTSAPAAELHIDDNGHNAGDPLLMVGDDTYFTDLDRSHALGLFSTVDTTVGELQLGSTGATLFGQNGNLGVGTTAPVQALDVVGNARITGLGGGGDQMVITNNTGDLATQGIPVNTDNQNLSLAGNTLNIDNGTSVDLSPFAVDNVNDADADPTNEFNTSAQINGSNLEITDGGGTISVNLGTLPADSDWLETGGNVVRTTGRVGVRTSAPAAELHIDDNGHNAGDPLLMVGDDTYFTDLDRSHALGLFSTVDTTVGELQLGSTGATLFGQNGNLGVGTTAPVQALDVVGNARITGLGGGGDQMVVTNNTGDLATQGIPVNTDNQNLSLVGNTLNIDNGTSVDLSPFAVDNVNDADADPTNEFNTSAQINGSNLEITDGGGTISVNLGTLPADSDWLETGGNVVRTTGRVGVRTSAPAAELHIDDNGHNAGDPLLMVGDDTYFTDLDRSNALGLFSTVDSTVGELQLGSTGATLFGQNGNLGVGTTAPVQALDVVGNARITGLGGGGDQMVVTNNTGDLATQGIPVNTDNQNLSLAGNTLNIDNGTSVDLSPFAVDNVNDADADPTNEFNTSAQINGSNLEITDGGGTISVNLGTLPADSDWLETGGNVVRTSGRVGVRTSAPAAELHIDDNGHNAGDPLLMVGDDTYFTDLDRSHALGLFSTVDTTVGELQLGSTGATLFGQNGNLGVGTTAPVQALDVVGNARITGLGGGGDQMVVTNNTGDLATQGIPVNTDNQNLSLAGNTLNIDNGTSVDLSPFAVDNVNDADADPTNEFNTSAQINGSNLEITDGGGTISVNLGTLLADSDWLETGGNVVRTSGRVGVRTSAPAAELHIDDNGHNAGDPLLMVGDDTYFTDLDRSHALGLFSTVDSTVGELQLGSTGATLFGRNGNLGVGTSTPGQKLHVEGNIQMVDGNQGAGNVAISDANGVMTWSSPEALFDYDWHRVYKDDFNAGNDAWTAVEDLSSTTDISGTAVTRLDPTAIGVDHLIWMSSNIGGDNVLKKGFSMTNFASRTEVMIKIRYVFVDTWDDESAWVGVSNTSTPALADGPTIVWTEEHQFLNGASQQNILSNILIGDCIKTVSATMPISDFIAGGLWLYIGANLSGPASDESFGIDDVEVWVR